MPTFVLEFDPFVRFGDLAIPWETLGLAGALLLALALAAVLGRRGGPGRGPRIEHQRSDDLLFIALGAVPGAVLVGRLGYVLLHWDFYTTNPALIVDPGQGGLQLSMAVLGGTLTGGYVAALVGSSIRAWLHVAALPLLLAIEGGKATLAWGGSGQGIPSSDIPTTAYLGPGPWGSLAPALPSIPSQLLEAGVAALAGLVIVGLLAAGRFERRDGRLYLAAIGLWLLGRLLVAATWRDPAVIGPLNADQVISIALLALIGLTWPILGRTAADAAGSGSSVAWPDEADATGFRRPELRPTSVPDTNGSDA